MWIATTPSQIWGPAGKEARKLGFHRLATGHYARIREHPSGWRLMCPADREKDQSYFLYPIKLEDLPFILFPLGGMTKKEVRKMAGKRIGFAYSPQVGRQDICLFSMAITARCFQTEI